jgi:hypothetical protein
MSATQQIVTRLREQRKGKVPVVVKGRERSIVFSRPTDLEMVEVNRAGGYFSDITSRFVVDWEGFIEDDLVGGRRHRQGRIRSRDLEGVDRRSAHRCGIRSPTQSLRRTGSTKNRRRAHRGVTAWLEAQERALISPVFSQELP